MGAVQIQASAISKEKRLFLDVSMKFCIHCWVPNTLNSSLSTLRGFLAAARLGSFAAAADELHLTHSAISHQIRTLEHELGQPLFRRVARSVVLTDAGKDFAQTVARVLRTLDDGVARLSPYRKPRSVILYTSSAFARGYLLPRLTALRDAHPDIDVWLDTSERAVDFEYDEVDILISAQARAAGPHTLTRSLLTDCRRPLAAPSLIAARGGPPATPAELRQWPLLHDEGAVTWRGWFDRAGLPTGDTDAGPAFSDHALALEAAAAGLGVVLGSVVAADAHLRRGTLRAVANVELPQNSYQICCDSRRIGEPHVRLVHDWLVSATGAGTPP
jgi:LysR family transcriptional regulator, glycine cleavage system transcriptional activator